MLTRSKFAFVLVVVALLLTLVFPATKAKADTGTYEINQSIEIAFNSNGSMPAIYHQTWKVTGGDIPWITIPMPNSSYSFLGASGNIQACKPANQGTWSGIRCDLDRDYKPGESFTVDVNVALQKMLYINPQDKNINIQYIPGWYDNAPVALTVAIHLPPNGALKLDPSVGVYNSVATWTTSLNPGGKYAINMVFSPSTFSNYQDNVASSGGGGIDWVTIIVIGVIVIIVLFVLLAIFMGDGYGGGGSGFVYVGGGSSCAGCAGCASCACACACAGGGGAGCKDKNRPKDAIRMNLEAFLGGEVSDASKRPGS